MKTFLVNVDHPATAAAGDEGLLGDLADLHRLIAAQADRVRRVHHSFASRTGRKSGG